MSRPVLTIAASVALSLASSNLVSAADVFEKSVNCANPGGAETTTVTVDLHEFSVPANWSEGGPNYEVTASYSVGIYSGRDDGKTGRLCYETGNWGTRDFRKYNLWSGEWWDFALGYRLVIRNVPVNGSVTLRLDLEEQDDSPNIDDDIDINPLYDDLFLKRFGESLPKDPGLNLAIYPAKRIARLRTSSWVHKDSNTTAAFDKQTRFTGSGPTSGAVDVRGRLKFEISAEGYRSPGLTSPGMKIFPVKSDAACRQYALTAVEDNRKAEKLGCGFNPPVWSNDHQMHFDWCMHGGNSKQAPAETSKRKSALAQCQSAKAGNSASAPAPQASGDPCGLYASEAIRLASNASAQGCGFFGPRWIQDYQAHYNFCSSGVNPAILFAEHAAREMDYRICTGS